MAARTTPGNHEDAQLVWERCAASRLDSVNLLRVAAFFTVLLDHFDIAGPLAGVGLPVFLFLTGFLTTSALLRERSKRGTISVRGFWGRRARRILPGLFGYLATSTALLLASDIHVDWAHLVSAVLQTSNYYEAVHGPQESYLSHTWSLGLQEQFILAWPFVVLLLGRDLRRLGVVTMASILAVWLGRLGLVLAGVDQSYVYRAFETRVDQILVGCLVAIVVHRRAWAPLLGVLVRRPLVVLAASASLLATSAVLQSALGPAYRDTIGFAVDPIFLAPLVLLLATFGKGSGRPSVLRRGVDWLGSVSYGLYLYHPLAISTVLHFSPHRGPLEVATAFVLSAMAAAASYYLVERPFAATRARTPVARTVHAPATSRWVLEPVRVAADRTSWVG